MNIRTTILFIFFSIVTEAQVSIRVLNNGNANTLYAGENNLVQLVNAPNGTKIRMSRGYVSELADKQYYIKESYCRLPLFDTMIFFKGKEILGTKIFRLKYRNAMIVLPAGQLCTDSFAIDTLIDNPRLYITPNNSKYRISGFSITVVPKRGEPVGPIASNTDSLNSGQLDMLKRGKKGDKYYIDDIELVCDTCQVKKIKYDPILIYVGVNAKPRVRCGFGMEVNTQSKQK
ncbi:hypothetical protein CAP35_00660 [Chitinophagaceae bacterium IBVUCB1]|nr:hypothetical protein CAP35_00660 [Chitinophagaceae bacterium IBVUCB1]